MFDRLRLLPWLLTAGTIVLGACHGSTGASPPAQDDSCAGPCPQTNIRHLVIVIQENHTFDDHFGGYCTAPAGSNPSCNDGPSCCEAMPATDPSGASPTALTDATNAGYDPNHTAACETLEIDGGKMDGFVTAVVSMPGDCGTPGNFAAADPPTMQPLWSLAATGALADRYFQ